MNGFPRRVRVSAAGPADAEDLAALIRDVYLPFTARFQPTALKWDARTLRDQAGYTLDTLSVAEPWRRRGIGTLLAGAACDRARCSGAARLVIVVRDSLEGNAAFFAALGYTKGDRFSPYHHLFEKEITCDRDSSLPGLQTGLRPGRAGAGPGPAFHRGDG